MKSKGVLIFLISGILIGLCNNCIDIDRDNVREVSSNVSKKIPIENLYTRIYRFIDYKEYEIAFSELSFYLRFYSSDEIRRLNLQNLFAKYIIEGEDSLENTLENYVRLFDFFNAMDAEAIYQMLMYRSVSERDAERAALIMAKKADQGRGDAGIYFFLVNTFYNLKMRELANRYLDCLLVIAPDHPATSYLLFKIRGKRPDYRSEAVESLKNLYYKDSSITTLLTVAMNFHIPSMMNREWIEIGNSLLGSEIYRVKSVAYSEIPIFFARNNDSESIYKLLKSQILNNDYRLFSLAGRSLLYVHKEPYLVIDRLRREYNDHIFVKALYARYLISLGQDYLNDAANLYIEVLEKDNNIEMFYEALEIFRRTSELFKLRSFAEELLFKYPYNIELYNIYRNIFLNVVDDDLLKRYFEHLPESPDRYILFSYNYSDIEDRAEYLLNGLKIYKGDCRIILELLKLYSDCKANDFRIVYRDYIKQYVSKADLKRCFEFMDEKDANKYNLLVKKGIKEGCEVEGR